MEHRRRHGTRYLIPAGILMGLGVGFLLNNPFPFLLIGLGLGFIGSSFEKQEGVSPADSVTPVVTTKPRLSTIVIGLFFVILGLGYYVNANFAWNYLFAGVLILLGAYFIVRASGRDF